MHQRHLQLRPKGVTDNVKEDREGIIFSQRTLLLVPGCSPLHAPRCVTKRFVTALHRASGAKRIFQAEKRVGRLSMLLHKLSVTDVDLRAKTIRGGFKL